MNASVGTVVVAGSPFSDVAQLFCATRLGGSDLDQALAISFFNAGPGDVDIASDGHYSMGPALDKFAYRGAFDSHTSYTYGDIVYFVAIDGPPNGPYWRCNNSYHLTGGGTHTSPNGSNGFDEVQFGPLPAGASITFEVSDTNINTGIARIIAKPHAHTNATLQWAVTKRR